MDINGVDVSQHMFATMKQFAITIHRGHAIRESSTGGAMNYKLLSDVTLAFVEHEGFDERLTRALKMIGAGLQLSRAYVFLAGQERPVMGKIREWCADGVASQWLESLPYSSYDLWKQVLAQQGKIISSAAGLSDALNNLLESHGIQSTVAFPIESGHEIVGFVSYDDCTSRRSWTDAEIDLMNAVSRIISAFVDREVLAKQLGPKRKAMQINDDDNSIYDPLTGLHNRQYVLERLKGYDAEYARLGRNFCVSVIDLDNFKSINYSYGREAGDFILQEFAKLLNDSIRPYDVCGRWGGEEFIIVSVNASATETVFMIERIMSTIRGRVFVFKGMDIRLRFSCGISSGSEFSPENLSIDQLLEMASRRMYVAKQEGRDRFVMPTPAT